MISIATFEEESIYTVQMLNLSLEIFTYSILLSLFTYFMTNK